jgi:hypothetical protein
MIKDRLTKRVDSGQQHYLLGDNGFESLSSGLIRPRWTVEEGSHLVRQVRGSCNSAAIRTSDLVHQLTGLDQSALQTNGNSFGAAHRV